MNRDSVVNYIVSVIGGTANYSTTETSINIIDLVPLTSYSVHVLARYRDSSGVLGEGETANVFFTTPSDGECFM